MLNKTHHETEAALLNSTETARLLGISRSELYRWRSAGRVPMPVCPGRRARWRRAELLAWIDAGCPSADRWAAMRKGVSA